MLFAFFVSNIPFSLRLFWLRVTTVSSASCFVPLLIILLIVFFWHGVPFFLSSLSTVAYANVILSPHLGQSTNWAFLPQLGHAEAMLRVFVYPHSQGNCVLVGNFVAQLPHVMESLSLVLISLPALIALFVTFLATTMTL